MKILVTGTSGYIGSRWATWLRSQGHYVVGLDRKAPTVELDRPIVADLVSPAHYEEAISDVDQVHHLAAAKGDWGISHEEYYRDNLQATNALIDVSTRRGLKQWIFYSTVAVLGPHDDAADETSPLAADHPYGSSKAECEMAISKFTETAGARVVTLRPSVVFGPDNPWNTNIFRLMESIHRNRFIMVGKGEDIKTTSYIDNLLAATAHLFRTRLPGPGGTHEIYHYVDQPSQNTEEIVQSIYQALGKRRAGLRLPLIAAGSIAVVADVIASVANIDLPITSARIKKFCTATSFDARRIRADGFTQPVSMQEAIDATATWYLDTYLPNNRAAS